MMTTKYIFTKNIGTKVVNTWASHQAEKWSNHGRTSRTAYYAYEISTLEVSNNSFSSSKHCIL